MLVRRGAGGYASVPGHRVVVAVRGAVAHLLLFDGDGVPDGVLLHSGPIRSEDVVGRVEELTPIRFTPAPT